MIDIAIRVTCRTEYPPGKNVACPAVISTTVETRYSRSVLRPAPEGRAVAADFVVVGAVVGAAVVGVVVGSLTFRIFRGGGPRQYTSFDTMDKSDDILLKMSVCPFPADDEEEEEGEDAFRPVQTDLADSVVEVYCRPEREDARTDGVEGRSVRVVCTVLGVFVSVFAADSLIINLDFLPTSLFSDRNSNDELCISSSIDALISV